METETAARANTPARAPKPVDPVDGCKLGKKGICTNECNRCGFYEEEETRRKQIIRDNRLTLCDDGLERLIIQSRKKEQED